MMNTEAMEVPPAPQVVQVAETGSQLTLHQGRVQGCEGYLHRKTKILKRWKKQWIKVVPG